MEEENSKANWRVYQLRKNKRSPEKKMSKKARRLAKAKAGKLEAVKKMSNQVCQRSSAPSTSTSTSTSQVTIPINSEKLAESSDLSLIPFDAPTTTSDVSLPAPLSIAVSNPVLVLNSAVK